MNSALTHNLLHIPTQYTESEVQCMLKVYNLTWLEYFKNFMIFIPSYWYLWLLHTISPYPRFWIQDIVITRYNYKSHKLQPNKHIFIFRKHQLRFICDVTVKIKVFNSHLIHASYTIDTQYTIYQFRIVNLN